MATALDYFHQRRHESWLVGINHQQVVQQVEARSQLLHQFIQQGILPKILLLESDPVNFLSGFLAACMTTCPVFLGNPYWSKADYQTVLALVQPTLIWHDGTLTSDDAVNNKIAVNENGLSSHSYKSWIMVPTGGSSGIIRFAIHSWATLTASVQGFQNYFQVEHINSCCALPLYHVSGLMQVMRSFTSGGQLAILPPKALETGITLDINPAQFFLSLVPTQLQRSLQVPEQAHWLAQFATVLLGGAPAWPELLQQARQQHIRLAPTYGMTETASQVATLRPEEFQSGQTSVGQVLPHAHIIIRDEAGQPLSVNQVGRVTIQAKSLALGYYPREFDPPGEFETDDLGFFDDAHRLTIVGRGSSKIITGGENVFPEEVEAAILATQLVEDVGVTGLPDRQWGEVVVAVYCCKVEAIAPHVWSTVLQEKLAKFKQPKYWIAVEKLPRNLQGKLNREQLKQLAATRIKPELLAAPDQFHNE
jgi:o-succinylbenzoate---CoA ligase